MIKHFYDFMPLSGEVIATRPTLFGKKYYIRVQWTNGNYTDFSRIWWRTWDER